MSKKLFETAEKKETLAFVLKKIFLHNRLMLAFVILGLVLNVIGWAILMWQINPNQAEVILHYNVYLGIDAISFDLKNNYFQIFHGPLGGFVVWVLNLFLAIILAFNARHDNLKETPIQDGDGFEKKSQANSQFVDINDLGSYIILASSVVIQFAILVYIAGIVFVNRG